MMRGLVGLLQVFLLLLPVIARPIVEDANTERHELGPVVQFEVVKRLDGALLDLATLRIQVGESHGHCGEADVRVNDQQLDLGGEARSGKGTLYDDEGRALDASWVISCHTPEGKSTEAYLRLYVDAVSETPIKRAGLLVHFLPSLSAVSDISGLGGTDVSILEGLLTGYMEDPDKVVEDDELSSELAMLHNLLDRLRDVEDEIRAKEKYISEKFGADCLPTFQKDCNGVKCVFKSVADTLHGWFKTQTSGGYTTSSDAPSEGPKHVVPSTVSSPGSERPMVEEGSHGRNGTAGQSRFGTLSTPPNGPQMSFTLQLAVILFIIFSLVGMCLHRLHRTKAERRALRQARRNARWRRRAERFNSRLRRKHAFKASVSRFFARVFGRTELGDEEKQAMFAERRRRIESERRERQERLERERREREERLQAQEAQPERTDSESELSTTMEQEIAQFRHAASLIDDMVAAEEQRQRERSRRDQVARRPPSPPPPPMPPSPTSAFPGYVSDDSLPGYDDTMSLGSSMVSDGFRFTPPSSSYTASNYSQVQYRVARYTPSSTSQATSGLDEVLGQTKDY